MAARQICPHCGSQDTSEILYGLPVFSEKLEEKISNKEIVLGGCCVDNSDFTHYCNSCEKGFVAPSTEIE